MRSSDVQPDIVPGQRVRHRRWMRRTRIRVGTTVDRADADPGVRTEPNPVRPATADIRCRGRGRNRARHGALAVTVTGTVFVAVAALVAGTGGPCSSLARWPCSWPARWPCSWPARGPDSGRNHDRHDAVTDTMPRPARCRDRGPSLPIQPRVRTRCIPPAQGSASCLVSGGRRVCPIRRTRRVSADTRLRSPAPSPRHRRRRPLRTGPRRAGRRPHPSAYPPAHRRRATRSEDPGPAHDASDSRYSFDRRTSAIGPSPSGSPTRIVSCSSTHQPSKPTAASAATIAGRSTSPWPSGT